jgi:putative methionine-R-sulfoxide reductase with GAF domain
MKSLRARFLLGGAFAMVAAVVVAILVREALGRNDVAPPWDFLLALFAVVAVLLVPLALSVDHWVLRPLTRMVQSNRQVREGGEEAAIIAEEFIPNNEIGELMRSRNEVLRMLLEQRKELADEVEWRQEEQESLRKVNRALRVLTAFNKAVVSAGDPATLLADTCHIAVEEGDYRLAWIGFAQNDEEKSVLPVAQAGFEAGYLSTVRISWADTERGRGPTGTAIRTGKPCAVRNILRDPSYTPWSAEAMKRGYASSLSLPLTGPDGVAAALNLYATEPEAFDDEEVEWLCELAASLSHGLSTFRTQEPPAPE